MAKKKWMSETQVKKIITGLCSDMSVVQIANDVGCSTRSVNRVRNILAYCCEEIDCWDGLTHLEQQTAAAIRDIARV